MKTTATTLALALTLTLTGCFDGKFDPKDIPDLTCEEKLLPPGVCVEVARGDPPVFRPCDVVDYLDKKCTFRVLDTVQVLPLEVAMTESECYSIDY